MKQEKEKEQCVLETNCQVSLSWLFHDFLAVSLCLSWLLDISFFVAFALHSNFFAESLPLIIEINNTAF